MLLLFLYLKGCVVSIFKTLIAALRGRPKLFKDEPNKRHEVVRILTFLGAVFVPRKSLPPNRGKHSLSLLRHQNTYQIR